MGNKPGLDQQLRIYGSDNFIIQNINTGVDEKNFVDIANSVFFENFINVSTVALETARSRLDSFHQDFIRQLRDRNPQLIKSLLNPNYQYVLYQAQSAHVRIGDDGLTLMLLEILLDLAAAEEQAEKKTLAESIMVIPKLSYDQLLLLSLVLLFTHRLSGLKGKSDLITFYTEVFEKVVSVIDLDTIKGNLYTSMAHLIYTKCVYQSIVGQGDWLDVLRKKYDLLLLQIPENTFEAPPVLFEKLKAFFDPVFESYWSCSYLSFEELDRQIIQRLNVSEQQISDFKEWLNSCSVSDDELKRWIERDAPILDRMRRFKKNFLPDAHLNSVGILLARKFLEKRFDIDFQALEIGEGIDAIRGSLGGVRQR